jgi:hypothetical protein
LGGWPSKGVGTDIAGEIIIGIVAGWIAGTK